MNSIGNCSQNSSLSWKRISRYRSHTVSVFHLLCFCVNCAKQLKKGKESRADNWIIAGMITTSLYISLNFYPNFTWNWFFFHWKTMTEYVPALQQMLLKQLLSIMKIKLKHYSICCVDSCLRKYHPMEIYLINAIRKQLIPWKNAFDCSISHLHIVLDKHSDVICSNTLPQDLKSFIQMQQYSFILLNVL